MADAATVRLSFTLIPSSAPIRRASAVRCGPRDGRPPILKGRILSTEAIHAIQSLKRAHRANPSSLPTHLLSRLLKSDLTAAMTELLRQDHCALAAEVLSALRSEYGADLNAYAAMVSALARNGRTEEIDSLIEELEADGVIRKGGRKGLLRLVTEVIGARRRESTVRIYGMIKGSGQGVEEYLGRVLSKGLRRFGEGALADQVDRELGRVSKGNFINSTDY